eukprot:RCo016070
MGAQFFSCVASSATCLLLLLPLVFYYYEDIVFASLTPTELTTGAPSLPCLTSPLLTLGMMVEGRSMKRPECSQQPGWGCIVFSPCLSLPSGNIHSVDGGRVRHPCFPLLMLFFPPSARFCCLGLGMFQLMDCLPV